MRRWAKGLAIAFGVLVLFAVWMIGGAAWITARPGGPDAVAGARRAHREVYVISNGYHAGLALPRARLAEFASGRGYPALIAVTQRFAAFDWIEFGWGEREFYQSVPAVGDIDLRLALRALFYPDNKTVVHVVGISGDPTQAFKAEMMKVPLSWNGFDRMLAKLDATFVPPRTARCPTSAAGSTGQACSIRRPGRSASRACAITGSAICSARPAYRSSPCSRRFRPVSCSICVGAQAFRP